MRYPAGDRLGEQERQHVPWLFHGACQLVRPTEEALAAELGVSLNTLQNWASGYSLPTKSMAEAAVAFFARRGVRLNLKAGTLRFRIADAVESVQGDVRPRWPKGRNARG